MSPEPARSTSHTCCGSWMRRATRATSGSSTGHRGPRKHRLAGSKRWDSSGKQESPTPDGKAYAGIFEGVRAVKSRWLIAAWLVVLVAYALPPAAAQQVVVIKAWTIGPDNPSVTRRSEEHTSELQSRENL